MDKTDIHSHILPGMDDGSANLEESLEMLRMAASQGFRNFIATPHYSPLYRNLCPDRIREQCAWLEGKAKASVQEEIRIYPGQELFYEDGLEEKLDEGKLLTLADSSYVLIEFAPRTPYPEMYRLFSGSVWRAIIRSWPMRSGILRYGRRNSFQSL